MPEIIETTHARESGHWYDRTGKPEYTQIAKSGKERPTTLADAKKKGLLPSVTTITKLMDKPGLVNWMIDQAILSALTCPRLTEESETELLSRIKKDAQEQAKKAAERGTQIHAWVEEGFDPIKFVNLCAAGLPFYLAAKKKLDEECGTINWTSEQTFATKRYAGKCDLHCSGAIDSEERQLRGYLIDMKTTDKPLDKLNLWDEHLMQLAAYNEGLNDNKRCGILYIHKETAECNLLWATDEQIERGREMFEDLVNLFYHKTGL